MSDETKWHELIAKYQLDQLTETEFAELEEVLRTSEAARQTFHRMVRIDAALRKEAERGDQIEEMSSENVVVQFRRRPLFGSLAAAAAVLILSALTITIAAQKRIVATVISTEDAAWKSGLPVVEGGSLTRGSLRLSEGIATIRFDSGMVLTLEAPARVFLKGEKKATLVYGTIVGQAEGIADFMIESEFGQAVLSDGEVVALFDKDREESFFEVISGEVLVSHDASREALKLADGESAILREEGIYSEELEEEQASLESFEDGLRLFSEARTTTFIRNNNPYKWTRPELLTLKTSISGNGFDRYSVVGFDLGMIQVDQVEDAVFRMNFVPSGEGLVSRLPKVNQFSVYGLVNAEKENWSRSDTWEDAPAPADGRLVGEFEMLRSQQAGVVEVSSAEVVELIRENAGGSVTFIVVRDTTRLEGGGHAYTHAFASGTHPETVGPVLELFLK